MALTQVSDVFVPRPFSDRVLELSIIKNALIQSGAVVQVDKLNAMASGKGLLFDIPYLNATAYGNVDGTLSSDDPSDLIVAEKVVGGGQTGTKLSRNWSWDLANLVTSVSGPGILEHAANSIADVFKTADQRCILSILDGVIATNADMAVDNSGVAVDRDMVVDAAYSMSDSVNDLAVAIMHPLVIAALKKQDLNNWTDAGAAGAGIGFETYLGMVVLPDASLPFDGTNYKSYFFKRGALSYGEGNIGDLATRFDREHKAGGGRGVDSIYYSRDYIYHPNGFSFTGAIAGATPTNAELAASTWTRTVDRRAAGIVQLVCAV